MRLRRCSQLLIQPRERAEFDLAGLLAGGDGAVLHQEWVALAPHHGEESVIDAADLLLLGQVGESDWSDGDALVAQHGASRVEALLARGLLVADAGAHPAAASDLRQRAVHWHPLAAALHAFGRWRGVDASDALTRTGLRSIGDLVRRFGPPPPHFHRAPATTALQPLPRAAPQPFDALLARRTTCRNFDPDRALPLASLATLLQRVFGAQAVLEPAPGASVVKKTSPSGGGLHATEAYLLLQQVEGVAPGLYHYHPGEHALAPLSGPDDGSALAALARRCVAGQTWFADAHALVMLTPRFARSFWKYRQHAKAYRALILDAGHLSQTFYLAATELGLGAFVTSAINEVDIEQAFGLDAAEQSPLAVCGVGWRGAQQATVEFDPLAQVWRG